MESIEDLMNINADVNNGWTKIDDMQRKIGICANANSICYNCLGKIQSYKIMAYIDINHTNNSVNHTFIICRECLSKAPRAPKTLDDIELKHGQNYKLFQTEYKLRSDKMNEKEVIRTENFKREIKKLAKSNGLKCQCRSNYNKECGCFYYSQWCRYCSIFHYSFDNDCNFELEIINSINIIYCSHTTQKIKVNEEFILFLMDNGKLKISDDLFNKFYKKELINERDIIFRILKIDYECKSIAQDKAQIELKLGAGGILSIGIKCCGNNCNGVQIATPKLIQFLIDNGELKIQDKVFEKLFKKEIDTKEIATDTSDIICSFKYNWFNPKDSRNCHGLCCYNCNKFLRKEEIAAIRTLPYPEKPRELFTNYIGICESCYNLKIMAPISWKEFHKFKESQNEIYKQNMIFLAKIDDEQKERHKQVRELDEKLKSCNEELDNLKKEKERREGIIKQMEKTLPDIKKFNDDVKQFKKFFSECSADLKYLAYQSDTDDPQSMCTICYKECTEWYANMPCGHLFCKSCRDKQNGKCHTCRNSVATSGRIYK